MKKIAIIAENSSYGGTSTYCISICKQFIYMNLDYILIIPIENRITNYRIRNEAIKFNLNFVELEINSTFDFAAVNRLLNILIRNNVSIVHTNGYRFNTIVRITRLYGLFRFHIFIHIVTVHGIIKAKFISPTKREKIYFFINDFLSFMNFRTIAVSDFTKRELFSSVFYDKKKVRVIYNINTIEASSIPKAHLISPMKHICFIGRLAPEKGIDFLISIIDNYLSNVNKDVIFDICGDGLLTYKIEELVNKYPENVVFHGFVENTSIILNASSITILTSVVETFGLVILEAFNHKVPVVASAVGGVPEIIEDGINGFLVQYGNVDEFVNKIFTLIKDDTLRNKFSVNAFNSLNEKFSIKISAICYNNILKEI